MQTYAFLDYGRWVANCSNCTNALALYPGQTTFACVPPEEYPDQPGFCGAVADLVWPDDPAAIEASVAGKPDQYRHWAPEPEEQE